MNRLDALEPRFVEFIPETLEPGVLYVSERFDIAQHLCACGCGYDAVTPFRGSASAEVGAKDVWTLQRDGDFVTLGGSVLNRWCGSHYFVERNAVRWC